MTFIRTETFAVERHGDRFISKPLVIEVKDSLDHGRGLFINDGAADGTGSLVGLLSIDDFLFVTKRRPKDEMVVLDPFFKSLAELLRADETGRATRQPISPGS